MPNVKVSMLLNLRYHVYKVFWFLTMNELKSPLPSTKNNSFFLTRQINIQDKLYPTLCFALQSYEHTPS